jgi:protein gp37
MKGSKIEWTDHTFNPWIGCTKVSPGCSHCYAEALNQRWSGGANWGKGAPRRRTSENTWRQPLNWDRDYQVNPFVCLACGKRCRHEDCVSCEYEATQRQRPSVFCASLADWLDDEVPIEWICNLLETVHVCQNLDWQLLTKRPQNWESRIEAVLKFANENEDRSSRDASRHDEFYHWLNLWVNAHQAPANVWIGTTAEDQQCFDERVEAYLDIPARVHFLSIEPMLSPVDVSFRCLEVAADWVICGGESGPGARPMHPDWARSLRDQCQAADRPFFFKQWGEWYPLATDRPVGFSSNVSFVLPDGSPYDPKTLVPEDAQAMIRDGKRVAGRDLDGRTWDEFPKVEVTA